MRIFIVVLLALGLAVPTQAQWHEAQSDHFVIYARDSAKDVQRFGEMLERYHAAMELLTGREVAKPSPSSRVTIYVVGGESKIAELGVGKNVAGFYMPRASGSVAFVPTIALSSGEPEFSVTVLMHEYAHHFLISGSRHAMPNWLSEGAAEFFASTKFPSDGSVQIGRPAYHRGAELAYAAEVSVEELLDYQLYKKTRSKRSDSYYGKAWALYHYLNFTEERRGQLSAYWRAVASGTPPRAAAEQIFGDFKTLGKELDAYLRKRRMFSYDLPPESLSIGQVSVRPLSRGHGETMPLVIRSRRGVDREGALELLPEIQEMAVRYPGDAEVLAALAEAEFDAGNDEAAIAAADRAIAIDPAVKNAYVQKGYALFRRAADADFDQEAGAYRAAMAPFTKLNALENDHVLPLIYFYRSFAQQGREPTEHARHALERALQLAPFDQGLAMEVALMQAQEGRIELARTTLGPLAANPHGGSLADRAGRLADAMAGAPEGERFDLSQVMAEFAVQDAIEDATGDE